jgi:hypothetical protein
MLIWKGHGILILVFGVIGSVSSGIMMAKLHSATQWEWVRDAMVYIPFWGAALVIWLYALTMGKTTTQTYFDPATQQPVVIRNSHTLFFIPPVPWAILATLIACAISLMSLFGPPVSTQERSTAFIGSTADNDSYAFSGPSVASVTPAGQSAFDAANRLITLGKGQTAFGNTPAAEKLAAEFAEGIKLGRQLGVQAAKKKALISFSNGQFLTYCRINPDSCAFMVHVPDLRKFKQDAKDYMIQIAWAIAMKQVNRLKPQPLYLSVGIRGTFLYDTVYEGSVLDLSDKDDDEDASKSEAEVAAEEDDIGEDYSGGIELRHDGVKPDKYLVAYFEPHPAGAILPTLITPGKIARAKTKPTASVPKAGTSEVCSMEELKTLLGQLAAMKPGQYDGNTSAARTLAASYGELIWSRLPSAASGEPWPQFSTFLHVVPGTAVFMFGLPEHTGLSLPHPLGMPMDAWGAATAAAAQMSPLPDRLAVIYYQEGKWGWLQKDGLRSIPATTWSGLQDLNGKIDMETLRPHFNNPPGSMDSVPSAVQLTPTSAVPKEDPAIPPASSAINAVAVPPATPVTATAPSLPTPLRDWKDATGRVMTASFENFTTPARDTGHFKRADGQTFDVPLARLSAEDQEFIRKLSVP